MKKFELSFDSIGCTETYTKEITILVVAPDKFDDKTGAMLFCHGWGGNRFQHQEFMKAVADKFNLLCLSPEYRMSGFDYSPSNGHGWFKPYDLSFYQTFDALLALRFILQLHTNLNHKRIFVYGGSQGGHIALLSAIYAPNTFAAVYSSSAMVCVPNQSNLAEATGRFFTDAECKVRSVPYLIDRLNTPLFMEHGTGDETVDHALNTAVVEALMKERGKPCEVAYYEGAHHDLSPVITKLDAFMRMAPKFLSSYETNAQTISPPLPKSQSHAAKKHFPSTGHAMSAIQNSSHGSKSFAFTDINNSRLPFNSPINENDNFPFNSCQRTARRSFLLSVARRTWSPQAL